MKEIIILFSANVLMLAFSSDAGLMMILSNLKD